MSLFEKVKKNVSDVVDDVTSTSKPAFVREVLETGEELKRYQQLLSNVENCFKEGKIDKNEYDTLKTDHTNRVDSLKSKIMSWKKEYMDLKSSLSEELRELQAEKSDAESELEKVEKHFSLQLITEEDYLGKKKEMTSTIKRTSSGIEKKKKLYDEIMVVSPYIEEE